MKIDWKWYGMGTLALSTLILALILSRTGCGDSVNPAADVLLEKGRVTDTLYLNRPYIPLHKAGIAVTPLNIIISEAVEDSRYHILKGYSDSLIWVIDSLTNELSWVSESFITTQPSSSKLLAGYFSKDTLKLDLLTTSGRVNSLFYPVNYQKYSYQYIDDSLRVVPLPKPDKFKAPLDKSQLFKIILYGQYYIPDYEPGLGIDYRFSIKRFEASALMGTNFSVTTGYPHPFLIGRVGVRLTK
jgi:hypothetical protein